MAKVRQRTFEVPMGTNYLYGTPEKFEKRLNEIAPTILHIPGTRYIRYILHKAKTHLFLEYDKEKETADLTVRTSRRDGFIGNGLESSLNELLRNGGIGVYSPEKDVEISAPLISDWTGPQ